MGLFLSSVQVCGGRRSRRPFRAVVEVVHLEIMNGRRRYHDVALVQH
jgi:hypothetical protein